MCFAVRYHFEGFEIKSFFQKPNPKLPVRLKNGSYELLPWGRTQQQRGKLPLGPIAKLQHLQNDYWAQYFPVPVKIPALAFMEVDISGHARWFPLTAGQWLQGVVATEDKERRVYIVTVELTSPENPFSCWPRIVSTLRVSKKIN